MLIKMKESKGFTLVELMIVVAIIGILAAVAVPFYQRYIQKSRLTSMVFPGVHSIQTNVGTYYSFKNELPNGKADSMADDADTQCFQVDISGDQLTITLTTAYNATRCAALQSLIDTASGQITFTPQTENGKIRSWLIGSNTLTESLGLAGEGSI